MKIVDTRNYQKPMVPAYGIFWHSATKHLDKIFVMPLLCLTQMSVPDRWAALTLSWNSSSEVVFLIMSAMAARNF